MRIDQMRSAYKSMVNGPQPAAVKSPWLSIVTNEERRRPVPTNEEMSAWIKAIAEAGDRQAFAALFKHFAPRVKSYLTLFGASDALAEELTQETMVSVWRKAGTFDPARAAVSTWMFAIARNQRVDYLRRPDNHLVPDLDDQADLLPDAAPPPDDQVLAAERASRVRLAMAKLGAEQRQLLHLSFFQEHPHSEIAQELKLPLGTVKSRIRLAVARLRQLLEGLEP